MKNRFWTFIPATKLGKWSVALIIAMFLLFFLGSSLTNTLYRDIPAGSTIPADIFARPVLGLAMLSGMLAGVVALFTGLFAIKNQHERSPLVYISTLIGALLLVFLIAEVLFPH